MIKFEVLKTKSGARRGRLHTEHGTVETPAYLPCGTHGTVKLLEPKELERLGLELILSNTYHLYLRPGIERIEALGGIHKFMGWNKAIFTDSGGFQAFSLGKDRGRSLAKTTDEGIRFRSHIDGSTHFFTPENVVSFQEKLGVDIATCLDVCTGFPETERTVSWAVDLTNQWAERSLAARTKSNYFQYGMVQGSIYPKLRERSASFLKDLPFDGYALGGNMYTFGAPLAELDNEKPGMWSMVGLMTEILPDSKPRHLLGVGEPADIIEGVRHGVDTFDCVMATRIARNGAVWRWLKPNEEVSGRITSVNLAGREKKYVRMSLTNSQYADDTAPLDEHCACQACSSGLSRAWFNHGFKVRESLAGRLATIHNLYFLQKIMEEIRADLDRDTE